MLLTDKHVFVKEICHEWGVSLAMFSPIPKNDKFAGCFEYQNKMIFLDLDKIDFYPKAVRTKMLSKPDGSEYLKYNNMCSYYYIKNFLGVSKDVLNDLGFKTDITLFGKKFAKCENTELIDLFKNYTVYVGDDSDEESDESLAEINSMKISETKTLYWY